MKRLVQITCLLLCVKGSLKAQTQLPRIVQPSPQAATIMKYGDFPVNYNTGVPEISIPLYTIKSGGLELPIILKYHASGLKPKEGDLSPIAAGWSLEAGGMITRVIKNRCDELYQRPVPWKQPPLSQHVQADFDYINTIYLRGKDSEHDEFSYSIPNKTGKFAIEDDGTGKYNAYSYPFVPYQFDVQTTPAQNYYRVINGIDVKDDEGNLYKFGHTHTETASTQSEYVGPTGWFLEEIESSISKSKITFSYDAIPEYQGPYGDYWGINVGNDMGVRADNPSANISYCSPTYWTIDWVANPSAIRYNTKVVSYIYFDHGYVKFNHSSDKRRINSIEVYDVGNNRIKLITLNRSQFVANSAFNKLNSIEISGQTPDVVEKYEFNYNENLPVHEEQATIDYWGYCNGYTTSQSNRAPIRNTTVYYPVSEDGTSGQSANITIGTASFDPSADGEPTKWFILEKIKYPTGGETEFQYEPNKYIDQNSGNSTQQFAGGGLRIKTITSRDNAGKTITKTYEYKPRQVDISMFSEMNYTTTTFYLVTLGQAHCRVGNCGPDFQSPYIFRSRMFSNSWNRHLGSNNVMYDEVTEYFGDQNTNTGKNVYVYKYENPNEKGIMENVYATHFYIRVYKNWGNGLLERHETYKKNGTSYDIVRSVTTKYGFTYLKTLKNLYVTACFTSYDDLPASGGYDFINYYNNGCYNYVRYPFSANDQQIVTGAYYLNSKEEKDYTGAGTLTRFTEYEYGNPLHFYPTKTTTTMKSGEKKVTYDKYVNEFSAQEPYTSMKGKNILKPLIEQKAYIKDISNNERLVNTVKTNYNFWYNSTWGNINANSKFLPQTVETSTYTNPNEVRLRYHSYDDKGNVTMQSKENDVPKTYIWGYNNTLPVAEVTGESYNNVISILNQGILQNPVSDQALRDELQKIRVQFPAALTTTYTFKPLFGITSETDAGNHTKFYEYDTYGRLKRIRDKDNNILKEFDYKFQEQQ
jgi:YD repeat-containing protein